MAKSQQASQKATEPAAAPKTEVAERPNTAVATADTAMFAADAGQGMEGATAESFAIPFLSVLQSNSPQVDEASGAAIEGARAGMFYENVTGKLVSGKPEGGGVRFVPCAYRRVFLRWGPRSGEGAGFKGELLPEEVAALRARGEIVEVDGRLYFPETDGSIKRGKDGSVQNDRLSDTRNHYVLLLNEDGSWQQALLSLTSTQIKKSKTLMAALASVKMNGPTGMFTPATFANVVRATTLPESNDKGNWFGIRMEIVDRVDRAEVYAAAKAFRDSVVKGQVEVKYEEPAGDGAGGEDGRGF